MHMLRFLGLFVRWFCFELHELRKVCWKLWFVRNFWSKLFSRHRCAGQDSCSRFGFFVSRSPWRNVSRSRAFTTILRAQTHIREKCFCQRFFQWFPRLRERLISSNSRGVLAQLPLHFDREYVLDMRSETGPPTGCALFVNAEVYARCYES